MDNRQLNERISELEKEAATLTLELKAAQARYDQEVVAHQETERSRMLSKEEANLEVVKGNNISKHIFHFYNMLIVVHCSLFCIIINIIHSVQLC